MFDTHFPDPTRETVGQRKSRKESKASGLSRGSSLRSSQSSGSASAAKPSLLNLFSSGSGRKGSLTRNNSQSKLSVLRASEASKSSRRISSYTVASDPSIPVSTAPSSNERPGIGVLALSAFDTDADFSGQSEPAESVFSGWTVRSSTTESSWGSVMNSPRSKFLFNQPLSPRSLISRTPEESISPRDSVNLSEQVANVVHISTVESVPVQVDSSTRVKRTSTTFEFPVPCFDISENVFTTTTNPPTPHPQTPHKPRPPPLPLSQPSSYQQDSWNPPSSWDHSRETNTSTIIVPRLQQPPFRSAERRRRPAKLGRSQIQRSIRRMEAASSKIILERLKEEWMEVADASVYRELELEKQRWMLFALRDLKTTRLSGCEDSRTIQVSTSGATKVLSLYENHASASFLSALSDPITEVHHLHPNPLSTKSYPNTKPFTIQEPTIQLPYPDNSLTSIHAFSLPTQFPASSIPTILKECHRLLSPNTPSSQSTLHLTLIDPLPISSTLGPLLRTWLEDHLIYNLERQFLCITPSRLFPMWLQDVGLRAEGSMILTVPFLASINTMEAEAILRDTNQGTGIDKTGIVKQELKSVVGRMLWKERWGGFVQAKRWWWEDEEIVGECERLRTCWEYSVIDAVKEG